MVIIAHVGLVSKDMRIKLSDVVKPRDIQILDTYQDEGHKVFICEDGDLHAFIGMYINHRKRFYEVLWVDGDKVITRELDEVVVDVM